MQQAVRNLSRGLAEEELAGQHQNKESVCKWDTLDLSGWRHQQWRQHAQIQGRAGVEEGGEKKTTVELWSTHRLAHHAKCILPLIFCDENSHDIIGMITPMHHKQ